MATEQHHGARDGKCPVCYGTILKPKKIRLYGRKTTCFYSFHSCATCHKELIGEGTDKSEAGRGAGTIEG